MPCVFVYGTLKRGDSRHHYLAGGRFLGPARTSPGYRLFHLGEYPGLIEDPAGGQVDGELYEVSDSVLALLDDVEGVDEGWYARRPIRLNFPGDARTVHAYFYLGDTRGMRELFGQWSVPGS